MDTLEDIRDQAQILGLRLRLDLVDLSGVEAWADATIVGDGPLPPELVDLCLARRRGRDVALARLAAIANAEPTASQIVSALSIVNPVRLGDAEAEKLAIALETVIPGSRHFDAPIALEPAFDFPSDFWRARVGGGQTGEVADAFRALLADLQAQARNERARLAGRHTVSAIVVSYHTGPVLMDCLDALELDPEIDEVVFVDNGNPAGAQAEIRRRLTRSLKLRVTGGGENRGFAAGVNLGAKVAVGDRLLVLNPDAILQSGSVTALEAARAHGAEPMVVGGRIFGPDGVEQRGGRRRRLTLGTAAGTFLGLSRLARLHPAIMSINRNEEPAPSGPVAMGAVSGALMYLSRAGFDRLGGFDENYFLHVEDLDLCRRAEADGGSVIYTPLASALHHGATSDAPSVTIERHKAAGLARYFRKFSRSPAQRAFAAILGPAITTVLVLRARLAPRRSKT
ncbi:MAG: glycosyltransferase [Alphaproteobacteria bacterium]|nr:glycosyltransferase [Alphaproteobacteria bacterium]